MIRFVAVFCLFGFTTWALPPLPLVFERNMGQATPEALYVARGPGYEIRLETGGVSLVQGASTIRMRLDGADPAAQVLGCELQVGRANYLVGAPERWRTGIPLYGKVEYQGVYPGTDLLVYGNGRQTEYDFSLAPGARVDRIGISFDGVERIRIEDGDLVLETASGELRHRKPHFYQRREGRKVEIAGHFVLRGPRQAGFVVDDYDAKETLTIDPVLLYGTYMGGTGNDDAWAVVVDAVGSVYVAGETWPLGFPRTFNFSSSTGNQDAFLVKLNPAGTAVVYATYFGGQGRDSARGVAVDGAGNAYVTGFTNSSDFPTTQGAFQTKPAGQEDAFVVKLNASGSSLLYSTLLGGAGADFATGIALDSGGNAYISGYTSSLAFPVTAGAFQRAFGGGLQDGFAAELNASGSALIYATYLGGQGNDVANGVAVDSLGSAYIVGYTDSPDFPVKNALSAGPAGQGDGFIAKLNPGGAGLAYATYLGGRQMDNITAVAVDASGNAYVTGSTLSVDFPTTVGAFQTANLGGFDAFVSKLNPQGNVLTYSTYLGAEGTDQGNAIAVDSQGVAYIAGFTTSLHFPLQAPVESGPKGSGDAFAAAVANTGATLLWSTYLGGSAQDEATAVAIDTTGAAYVVGFTFSPDFPTTSGAYHTGPIGGSDAFVVKLGTVLLPPQVLSLTPSSGSGVSQTFSIAVSDTSATDIAIFLQVNSQLSPVAACEIVYDRSVNQLWLIADNGTTWLAAGTVGSGSLTSNTQCSVDPTGSSQSQVGNILTLNVRLVFKPAFSGAKQISLLAQDQSGLNGGWQQMGTWAYASALPSVISLTPSSGSGASQTFSVVSNTSGATDVAIFFQVNSQLSPVAACEIVYDRSVNQLWLIADNGSTWLTAGTLGSGSLTSNTQCSVDPTGSSQSQVGNILTLNVRLVFKPAFSGAKQIFLLAQDQSGLNAGWQQMGSWTY
jgi:hypothetical protein